jgi:DMATS type aromatic prenyltransferase
MTASENISTVFDSIDLAFDDAPISLEERPDIVRQSQVGFDPEQLVPAQTYVECGIEKLTALCHSVGLSNKIEQITEIFRTLTSSWGETAVGAKSAWQSDVSDDGAPFEFSIAFDSKKAELRVLVEAQGSEANLQSNWQAGLDLNQQLAEKYHVSLDRFQQISDLFAPTNSTAKFSIWHSACFYPDKEPAFKLYLNPQAQSQSKAAAIVEESLVRLGFDRAWPTLAETAAQRGPNKDEFVYFSLDLAAHPQARVKVYIRHHDATPAELESALSAARNYVAGDAIEFCQAMAPGQTLFAQKPVTTYFSWVEGDNNIPSCGTLQLPIAKYVTDDRVVCDCLDLYFIEHAFPVSVYQSALKSFAKRQLEAGVGMHSYVSLGREQQDRRVTIYLNPEVNIVRPNPITTLEPVRTLSSLATMVGHHEKYSLVYHPFFQRLEREPLNLQHIWLFFTNIQEWVTHFTPRLASIIARIDDERIRCILAHQLNDEMGNGDVDRIHSKLFEHFLTTIEPWRMEHFTDEMLILGKEFSKCLEDIYLDPNPYVGMGGTIVMEIYGKQFDLWLGQELRNADVDLSKLTWLTLHEKMEIEHANESLLLAQFIDDSSYGVVATREGMNRACVTSWNFLNGLYKTCYTLPDNIKSV